MLYFCRESMPCYGSIVNGWARFYIIGVFRRFVVDFWNLANSFMSVYYKATKMSYGYVYMGVVYLRLYIRRGLRVACFRLAGNARASEAELQQWSPAFFMSISEDLSLPFVWNFIYVKT